MENSNKAKQAGYTDMSQQQPSDLEVPQILEHLARKLSEQGTCLGFTVPNIDPSREDPSHDDAFLEIAGQFGAQTYWPENKYRDLYRKSRIEAAEVEAVLSREAGAQDEVAPGLRRAAMRSQLLLRGMREYRPETIRWQRQSEGGVAADFDFWLAKTALSEIRHCGPQLARRPQEYLLQKWGIDSDAIVNPLLIRLSASFLKPGSGDGPLVDRRRGFWRCAVDALRQPNAFPAGGMEKCERWLTRVGCCDSQKALERLLIELGTGPKDWPELLEAELQALPGCASVMRQWLGEPGLPDEPLWTKMQEFLAVRILLTVAVCDEFLPQPHYWRNEFGQRERRGLREERQWTDAAKLAEAAAILGISREDADKWERGRMERFMDEVRQFDSSERRRVWHEAFQGRSRQEMIQPVQ